jgi:hypothetical protein
VSCLSVNQIWSYASPRLGDGGKSELPLQLQQCRGCLNVSDEKTPFFEPVKWFRNVGLMEDSILTSMDEQVAMCLHVVNYRGLEVL